MLFTSESVSEGHPDKLADRISDTILDRFLRSDPLAKVACETFIADDLVVVAGEFHTTPPKVFQTIKAETPNLIRQVIRDTGYTRHFPGIDPDTCEIRLQLNQQSGDIRQGVDTGGAGDQGLVFGYATDETEECMPLTVTLAHKLNYKMAELRRNGVLWWARPDSKTQVCKSFK
jgi:S-adenosylmethionine synthetase